jgi:hypothetical protein
MSSTNQPFGLRPALLFGSVDAIDSKVCQRAYQAASAGHCQAGSEPFELSAEVKNSTWHMPPKSQEATELRACVVTHKKRFRADWKRWLRPCP